MPPRREQPCLEETLASIAEQLSTLVTATTNTSSRIDALTHAIAQQSDNINAQLAKQPETTANLVKILLKPTNGGTSSSTVTPNNTPPTNRPQIPPPPHPTNHGLDIRPPKITLSKFDGSNPLDWIFQADQYFTFYNIEPSQRLKMASFHLTGDALSWYKYLFNNKLLTTWDEFTRALETRFGPSTYDNHQATLFKLRQTSTVAAYQTEFEKLSNCVVGLTPDALLNCFISGLRLDIQQELSIQRPLTITHAFGLAKLIEDKLNDQKQRTRHSLQALTFSVPQITTPGPNPSTATRPKPPLLPTPPKPPASLPFTRLSAEAMQQRRAAGLCFRCPEKFHPGHKCNPPQFLLVVDNDDPHDPVIIEEPRMDSQDPLQTANPETDSHCFTLSSAAFLGLSAARNEPWGQGCS